MLAQSEKYGLKAQTACQAEQTNPVRTVHRLEDFDAIFDDGVDAVVWSRQAPASVLSALKALPDHEVENGRFCVPVSGVGDCVADLFSVWGWRAGPAHSWIAHDIEALAAQMAQTLSISHVLLRVELVRDDACCKFHRDTVRARLICTYSGPGTELGIADNGEQPRHIDTVATGSPVLLKGKRWPGSTQGSIKHRSPPIEETGLSRLVVVLDEAQLLTEPAITP